MATYKENHGTNIETVTSDPDNPDNWDGTPVQCCWCDSGSPVCNVFEQATCPDGTTPMKEQALDCGHGGMAK